MTDPDVIPMSEADLRDLATELQKDSLAFDPSTIRKATVVAVDFVSSPPTISVQLSGDTSVTIAGVRIINGYVPVVSDSVLLFKQGRDVLAWGKVATTAPGPDLYIRAGEITSGKTGTTNWVSGKLSTVDGANRDHHLRQPIDHRIRSVSNNIVVAVTDTTLATQTFTTTGACFSQVNATLTFDCDEGASAGNVEPARATAWYRIVRVSDSAVMYLADAIYTVSPQGHDTWNTTSIDTVTIADVGGALDGGVQYRLEFIAKRFSVLAVRFNHAIGYVQEAVRMAAS